MDRAGLRGRALRSFLRGFTGTTTAAGSNATLVDAAARRRGR